MKTDRELLELAAKAAHGNFGKQMLDSGWSPLTDDGDALRLAVKLRLRVCTPRATPCAIASNGDVVGYSEDELGDQLIITDPYIATRRAIVRAAAALALLAGVV
jgi:hypothetical protein